MTQPSELAGLVAAIKARDAARVRDLVSADPPLVNAPDPGCFGATPLIHAVGTDDTAIVDLLLELGADINRRSDWWAGSFGVLDSASDSMAEHLLARGATLTPHAAARLGKIEQLRGMIDEDSSVVSVRGGDGQTPLHFARTVGIAELLLRHGASIDALDIDHASTPAQWLGGSRPEVAGYLVSRGAAADPFLAVRTGNLDLLERLIGMEADGVAVRVTRARFPTSPPAAGHIYLYTIGEGCGLVHAAVQSDRPDVILWLVARGADANARGGYDDATPLHLAAWNDKPAAAAALLDCGAKIDIPSGVLHRNEPIGWAIVAGSVGAFRLLRERGATIHSHHIEDARKGSAGAFRAYNPHRPIEAWREIDALLGAR